MPTQPTSAWNCVALRCGVRPKERAGREEAICRLDDRRTRTRPATGQQISTPKGRLAFVELPASQTYFLTVSKAGFLD
jgi:hypothetical protein